MIKLFQSQDHLLMIVHYPTMIYILINVNERREQYNKLNI